LLGNCVGLIDGSTLGTSEGTIMHKPHVHGQLRLNSDLVHILLFAFAAEQSFFFPEVIANFPTVSIQIVGALEGCPDGLLDGAFDGVVDGKVLGY